MNPFKNQYHLTYQFRLNHLKPQLMRKSLEVFNISPLENIYEVNNVKEETVLIGILYIDSELKPSLFNNIKKTNTYFSPKNKFYLEDGSRIELKIEDKILSNNLLCTGMVLALKGICKENMFYVNDYCFSDFDNSNKNLRNEKYEVSFDKVCFISCIKMKENKNYEKLILILKYLNENQVPVCIIGPYFSSNFDIITLKEILSINTAYLVPGKNDPTSKILPQKPLHNKLCHESTICLGNPTFIESSDKSMLITDGCNVEDMLKYFNMHKIEVEKENKLKIQELDEEEITINEEKETEYTKKVKHFDELSIYLDAMEVLYASKHFCPTAPDTLHSEPIIDIDPFIFYAPINIFVCGNGPSAALRKSSNVNFISVPKFSDKNECLIYDFKKEAIEIIKINE